MVEVVGRLLARLRRDRRERFVSRAGQPVVQEQLVGGEHQQLRHRDAEVAGCAGCRGRAGVGQLDQQAVAELVIVAPEGEVVLVPPRTLHCAGVGEHQARDAELVEGDVGQRDVLLHLGGPGRPLAQPLRGDQRVVADAERVLEHIRGHRCLAPSGTS